MTDIHGNHLVLGPEAEHQIVYAVYNSNVREWYYVDPDARVGDQVLMDQCPSCGLSATLVVKDCDARDAHPLHILCDPQVAEDGFDGPLYGCGEEFPVLARAVGNERSGVVLP